VANTEWQRLGDIPKSVRLGTALASLGERNFIVYNEQQPKEQRWVRLPYADPNLMATRVLDGTIGGMVLWQPVLARLIAERPEAAQLRVIANDPMGDSVVQVGALVSSRNGFLRSQVDETIDALVADGTIDALLKQFGYSGRAGR
jgi:polar amino acid transport system substrate-binding protein